MPTLPQVSGPTEHALRALLERELAISRIPSYLGWVCLNLAAGLDKAADLPAQLDRVTKCGRDRSVETVDQLTTLGLLSTGAKLTPGGDAELVSTRQRVKAATDQVTAGLTNDDVRTRAEAMLEQ